MNAAETTKCFRYLLALIATALLAGCKPSPLVWKEDVLLPDGRTVTLSRKQIWNDSSRTLDKGPADSSFEFTDPDTKQRIRWASNDDYSTRVLFKHAGTVYLLTSPAHGGGDFRLDCPTPSYLLFKWIGDRWQAVWLPDIPVKRLYWNMTINPDDNKIEEIEKSNFHLSADATMTHIGWESSQKQKPMNISFEGMTYQTFGRDRCKRGSLTLKNDYLLTN